MSQFLSLDGRQRRFGHYRRRRLGRGRRNRAGLDPDIGRVLLLLPLTTKPLPLAFTFLDDRIDVYAHLRGDLLHVADERFPRK